MDEWFILLEDCHASHLLDLSVWRPGDPPVALGRPVGRGAIAEFLTTARQTAIAALVLYLLHDADQFLVVGLRTTPRSNAAVMMFLPAPLLKCRALAAVGLLRSVVRCFDFRA